MKKQLPYFLIAFVLPVTTMLWWWGLFSTATIETGQRGGYHYTYMEAQGPYSKLSDKQNEVRFELKKQGITPGAEVTLVLSDPRNTPYDQLQARTGYIIGTNSMPLAPLKTDTIAMRQVAVARIKAHPLLAYGKTYSALLDFCKKNNIPLNLPTLEIYDDSVLYVEMPLSADKTAKVSP